MLFKVTLARTLKMQGNPFVGSIMDRTAQTHIRAWEIEAKDEAEIRGFLDDAIEKRLPNVLGYHLRSIEPIESPNAEAVRPAVGGSERAKGWAPK